MWCSLLRASTICLITITELEGMKIYLPLVLRLYQETFRTSWRGVNKSIRRRTFKGSQLTLYQLSNHPSSFWRLLYCHKLGECGVVMFSNRLRRGLRMQERQMQQAEQRRLSSCWRLKGIYSWTWIGELPGRWEECVIEKLPEVQWKGKPPPLYTIFS